MRTTAPSTAGSIFKAASFIRARNWRKKHCRIGLGKLTEPLACAVEAKELIRRGMVALPDTQRNVIEMACYEGLSMREIADRTGYSFVSVRHHYYRGLQKLHSLISGGDVRRPSVQGGKCA
jgi:DNA-directed RNA polymerase specialized sigma24 family protein